MASGKIYTVLIFIFLSLAVLMAILIMRPHESTLSDSIANRVLFECAVFINYEKKSIETCRNSKEFKENLKNISIIEVYEDGVMLEAISKSGRKFQFDSRTLPIKKIP
jgi:hypothetical protein